MNLLYRYSIVKFSKPSDSKYRKEGDQYGVCAHFLFTTQFVYDTNIGNSVFGTTGLEEDGRPASIIEHSLDDATDLYNRCMRYDTPSAWLERKIDWIRNRLKTEKDFEVLSSADLPSEKALNKLA
jgi:hypothetical protein